MPRTSMTLNLQFTGISVVPVMLNPETDVAFPEVSICC